MSLVDGRPSSSSSAPTFPTEKYYVYTISLNPPRKEWLNFNSTFRFFFLRTKQWGQMSAENPKDIELHKSTQKLLATAVRFRASRCGWESFCSKQRGAILRRRLFLSTRLPSTWTWENLWFVKIQSERTTRFNQRALSALQLQLKPFSFL